MANNKNSYSKENQADFGTANQVISVTDSVTVVALTQLYRALKNDAVLRQRFANRWEQPAFAVTLLRTRRKAVLDQVQQLHEFPSTASGSDSDDKSRSFQSADLRERLKALQNVAKLGEQQGKFHNKSLWQAAKAFWAEVEGMSDVHWEADDQVEDSGIIFNS